MMINKVFLWSILCTGFFVACRQNHRSADLIITDAAFYTATDQQIEAIAIRGDRIIDIGSKAQILKWRDEDTKWISAKGRFVMPGLIEGHGHFYGLGQSRLELNFLESTSWEEILNQVANKAATTPKGSWIIGRGWHQEKWGALPPNAIDGYPHHMQMSDLTPDHPVMLMHASGHALFANKKAMELAGMLSDVGDPDGGRIVRDAHNEPIGIFEENAMEIIRTAHQQYIDQMDDTQKQQYRDQVIAEAQKACLEYGITSFQDAGSSFDLIDHYAQMAKNHQLDIRLWVMLRHSFEEMKNRMDKFPMLNIADNYFSCRAIKTEVDGALGSYGAWLLEDYNDKKGFRGQNTTSMQEVERIARLALQHDMQLCVHAIGDRANKEVLDIIRRVAPSQDKRWRIEHAQHLDPQDIPRFAQLGVIASMQGIHCTSDAPFVIKRLGVDRARRGAYAWRSFLDAGVPIANGTDVPVESISPFECIYASVTRKRKDSDTQFFPEQSMTRDEALKSYTLWNAYAAFEDKIKGSLEPGKLADLVILSEDLLNCPVDKILQTQVVTTIVGGKIKYSRPKN